ncbi:hypothetical protein [Flaviaesturariibacter terrae]
MKHLFYLLLLLCAAPAFGQEVTGLYSGTLRNDSTGLVQQYELSITEEGGKVSGYAHTTFVLDNRMHFGFRKVKGLVKAGKLVIEESDMLENNFPTPPPKGIRRTSLFSIPYGGPVDSLVGRWSTNRTRNWAPATGTLALRKKRDSSSSALVAKLRERFPPAAAPAAPQLIRPLTFTERKTQTVQTLRATADTVQITLYDNGLVDGDSVSVYLNGVALVEHIKLSENAFRYTVPLKPGINELSLLAENLGTLPPNTGLLIVQTSEARYPVYFSADLQTNARILIQKNE